MSERTPFTSPPLYTQSGDDTNSSITGGEKRNGVGASSTQEFRQNHPQTRPPQPHELTAEWTVRAQLTFARAGEKVKREFTSNDPLNPVRVVYKWSTLDATATSIDNEDDLMDDDLETTSTLRRTTSSHASGQSTPLKRATPATPTKHHQSFHSTTSSVNAPTTCDVDGGGADSAFSGSRSSRPTTLSSSYKEHSTSGPNGSGMAAAAFYGTRCRSTCNIVVSAVADFLPPNSGNNDFSKEAFLPTTRATTATDFVPEMEPDPFVYNTTASYTVLPQQSMDDNSTTASTSKNFKVFGKMLDLRDAFCQTSDTETQYFEEQLMKQNARRLQATQQQQQQQYQQPQENYQRRLYDQRRLTAEGLLQPSSVLTPQSSRDDNESNVFMHSKTPTPSNTFKSASMSRIPQLLKQQQVPLSKAGSSTTEPQKKPRTVHIDVYCTGSEDDEQADAEASSSSDDGDSKRHEVDSTSTRQTVLDNEQMRLRHQRMSGPAMPRRIANQQQQQRQQNLSSQSDLNLGHGVTKSSTAEEVSESKQLLFRKHIGDQRAAKLATLRQKYLRQTSDDALSSTYPNSSRSTVRDATCSSISSAVPSSHGATDAVDSSWKETEEADDYQSLGKSDSFEYANSVDRFRIREMEKLWSRDEDMRQSLQPTQQNISYSPIKPSYLQTISEGNSQPSSPYRPTAPLPFFQRNDTINSDLENFSESDVFYGYQNVPKAQSPVANYRRQFSQPLPQAAKSPSPSPPKVLKPIPPFLQQTSHFPRNRPGFLQFFGPGSPTSPLTVPQSDPNTPLQPTETQPLSAPIGQSLYPNYQPNLQRWKSEARDNLSSSITPVTATSEQSQRTSSQPGFSSYTPSPQRAGSEAPPTTTSAATFPYQSNVPIVARRFDLHRDSPAISEASTVLSGYTPEYLEKARKFGKVVNTVRKPGHHVGPTKNPNCSCESCQRWMAERFQLRGRAFSLGERPILKRPTKF